MQQTRRYAIALALAVAAGLAAPATAGAERARLGGSPASMARQHDVAVERDLSFMRTAADVRALAAAGQLEPVRSGANVALADVSFPFARPEVRVFIERLGAQYREATGARLVVTSLTRPTALQPRNAHALSVHPAGMAVDFRIPADTKARVWLENALLSLERDGLLDVTRERTPPHYHVAVYPAAYRAHVTRIAGAEAFAPPPPVVAAVAAAPSPTTISAESMPVESSDAPRLAALATLLGALAVFAVVRTLGAASA